MSRRSNAIGTAARRADLLRAFGADASIVGEVLAYDPEPADGTAGLGTVSFPLEDEPFVATWCEYRDRAARAGFLALADCLVQLQFPIAAGISETEAYRLTTRRGAPAPSAAGLELQRPQEIEVVLHPTWAGAIPIVQLRCREDFESLVRAFTARNEPEPISPSMGACIVAGYNNWHRFARLRERWMADHRDEPFSIGRVAHLKEQYQDRFVLLTDGYYSDVPPDRLGLADGEWRALSVVIRREHECAHYWTRRVTGSMRNCLRDEVMADFCGLVAACGEFKATWLLTFLGVDETPHHSGGGRAHNYRGRLSDAAFAVLQRVVVAAVANLDVFARRHSGQIGDERGSLAVLLTLSRLSLEELADDEAPGAMARRFAEARTAVADTVTTDIRFLERHARG